MAKLNSKLAKFEGLKSQTSIGNIREIRKGLETILAQEAFDNGYEYVSSDVSPSLEEIVVGADKKLAAMWKKAKKT